MTCESEDLAMHNQRKFRWTLYISTVTIIILVAVTEIRHNLFFNRDIRSVNKYVIVFDGGSTGTRIHIFTFENSSNGLLSLKNEYYEEVKPGLSNFANKPRKAGKSVLNLLEKAKTFVPSNYWDATPVVLKATAGLRLLPKSLSDSILDEVSKVFRKSPFLADENSVEVLDGEDEGLYAWYTLNFLLGRLNESNQSVASLDLGGGSTQVTFSPSEIDTLVHSPKDYIMLSKIQDKHLSIYTHSYLGLGLMSARLSILKQTSDPENGKVLISPCIHPQISFEWNHDQKDYAVRGKKSEEFNFQDCYDLATTFLGETVDKPEELQKREIFALSYYFDRALDLGLIGPEGGLITVGEFKDRCKKACNTGTSNQAFLCLDCSYISALLHHGLGFSTEKEIRLVKQIDGVETSWGLGAAFNMLS